MIHRDISIISIFTISINNERFLGLVFITFCCFMRDDLRIQIKRFCCGKRNMSGPCII